MMKKKTRPDTRLPLSRAGGQEQCWRRSLGYLDRSRMLKKLKNTEKVIVAKTLDGQRYPLPLCVYMWVCDGERGSGPKGADDLCLVSFEVLG